MHVEVIYVELGGVKNASYSAAKLASTLTSAGFMRLIILRICNVGPVGSLSCVVLEGDQGGRTSFASASHTL